MRMQTEDKIKVILDKVRPFIKMHGGDVKLVGFNKGGVTLEIKGACVGCHLADVTYNQMIGSIIKKEIPTVKKITLINNDK
ncbi:hypothetical protein A3H53_02920 [Candidatus Nomurabacteria bacterium RIFCSPLOWO2_02_FULL_40_10]|uniref:NIF system FeS cluster assembly NifU C-terminal domain-containing protein n=1 Tax=Candidatus Nomurabacteria bacterium RIFCSPLOWO2_02_FULL_40_10 TaxID=1801786 RepID=A0A1F6XZA2_9BACT|nr:MAG: hypothetical protein A3H53_02920 [Candidatus Nomurabacteria bacterium RIFCSPLOWO2_02_FULL_40_10]